MVQGIPVVDEKKDVRVAKDPLRGWGWILSIHFLRFSEKSISLSVKTKADNTSKIKRLNVHHHNVAHQLLY